jgi:hypothetical protein
LAAKSQVLSDADFGVLPWAGSAYLDIMRIFFILALSLVLSLWWTVVPQAQEEMPMEIRGVYGHPQALWDKGLRLDELGVNAVFVHSGAVDTATVERAQAEGCKIFAEFAMLNGSYGDYAAKHPEAHPMDETGQLVDKASWFLGACPTDPGFRAYRMQALRRLLEEHAVDGVWMDYLHWHAQFEDPYPILAKTCFNRSCRTAFAQWAGVEPQGDSAAEQAKWILDHAPGQWEDWRVEVLVGWARQFHSIVKEVRPEALVGNFQAAWKDEDFWGARRRCLGLDFEALRPYVDVFSPMPYHGRSGMPLDYIRDYVEYFGQRLDIQTAEGKYPRMWPIVQAYDDPPVTADQLVQALRNGLAGRSSGVMMFTSASVAEDKKKLAAVKAFYLDRAAATKGEIHVD